MSTRNVTMVVHRSESEKYVKGFAVEPTYLADNSYVNMYLHHDGYLEYQGVQTAKWIKHMQEDKGFTSFGDGSRIAAHLVKDMHYPSQYLYSSVDDIDHKFTYIIWVGKPDAWISVWNNYESKCVFVGSPDSMIKKYYEENMDYTDWNFKTSRGLSKSQTK